MGGGNGSASSVVNCFDAEFLELCQMVLHGLEDCRGVSFPVRKLAVTFNGCRDRYGLVGLPGNLLSVRFGSSSMGPVGSTR